MLIQDIKIPDLESLVSIYKRVLEKPTFIDTNIFIPITFTEKGNPFSMMNILHTIQQNISAYRDFINPFIEYFKRYTESLFDKTLKNFNNIIITKYTHNEILRFNEKLDEHISLIDKRLSGCENGIKRSSPEFIKVFHLLKDFEKFYKDKSEKFLSDYSKVRKFLDGETLIDFDYTEYQELLEILKGAIHYKVFEVRVDFLKNLLLRYKEKYKSPLINLKNPLISILEEELTDCVETTFLPYFYYNLVRRFSIGIDEMGKNITKEPFYLLYKEIKKSRFYPLYNFSDQETVAIALCLASSTQQPYRILSCDNHLIKILKYSYKKLEEEYRGRKNNFTNIDLEVYFIYFSLRDDKTPLSDSKIFSTLK